MGSIPIPHPKEIIMKKIIVSICMLLFLSIPTFPVFGGCQNQVDVRVISPTIHHVFIDEDCDWVADIVVEFWWNGFRWVPTGNWWRLR
jgi:hypothetical protein